MDFFFRKTILSDFTFYAIFNIKKINIEKCPFTYWLNGRWFLQIVERDSWNLYPLYPLCPCSDFVSQMGGGGCNVFLTFFTYWLNGRWFLQIVERDSWNLYPLYPLCPCSDFVSQMGGGVMFFSHFMLFRTFLEKKSGNTKQLFLI